MNSIKLRKNQLNAINASIENDFKSGIHFHATGTGKSWIALEIMLQFIERYPKSNIIWLCEQKSILMEQFNKKTIYEKGYGKIYEKFMVINYTVKKDKEWYSKLNSSQFWGKPVLLIINRSYLVSQLKYKMIRVNIDMIIHDECHTINNTTKKFYDYMIDKYKDIRCIGFSATPSLVEPYKNIISKYTIYDAFLENVIVPPKIKFIKSKFILNDNETMELCKRLIEPLPYKKIIVWCGIIQKCNELSKLWKETFQDYLVITDTSYNTDSKYEEYLLRDEKAIMFCASKHREGSDIKNLDCCIFLDKVENRGSKVFVQSIGRVLRKDKLQKKKFGLILDFKASSCIKICDRMNEYLSCEHGFPWQYYYKHKTVNNKSLLLHTLKLKKIKNKIQTVKQYTIHDLVKCFIKPLPDNDVYKKRLNMELKLIKKKKLESYLLRAVEILKITNYIPHVTRGSCGSSLVCYLLGISNVDPIEMDISFSRFLNKYRNNLPDIDFDFPHYLRDEVFLRLELKWPNQVARISNHVYWHERSALREAFRRVGIKKQIPKEYIYKFLEALSKPMQNKIKKIQKELENTFRYYSLHCGGIIFFHEGVPKELVLNKKTLNQIVYDKRDVAKRKNFKIDILSSRGISQLIGICGNQINFADCEYDERTYKMLQEGDNIGITLAESTLMRKAMLTIKPKSIKDIAICLAIVRPAAKDARVENNDIDYDTKFIYDDDAIRILSKYLKISEGLADKFRRCLSKNKWEKEDKMRYRLLLNKLSDTKRNALESMLQNLRYYGFCKAHSYSYAQLVYKLAYEKANNTKKFWESTIKNVNSSYRKWVHLYEACRNGVDIEKTILKQKDCSIYAECRRKKFHNLTIEEQLKKYGYWDMKPYEFYPKCYFYKRQDEYCFSGLIASMRVLNHKPYVMVVYVGVSPGKFIEVLTNKYMRGKKIGMKGRCKIRNPVEQTYKAHIAVFY